MLALLATGAPTATIARRLGLAPKTVRNHSSAVFTKLGVTTRADATAKAHAAGLSIPVRVNPGGVPIRKTTTSTPGSDAQTQPEA